MGRSPPCLALCNKPRPHAVSGNAPWGFQGSPSALCLCHSLTAGRAVSDGVMFNAEKKMDEAPLGWAPHKVTDCKEPLTWTDGIYQKLERYPEWKVLIHLA